MPSTVKRKRIEESFGWIKYEIDFVKAWTTASKSESVWDAIKPLSTKANPKRASLRF
jgi:hypothetical protein